FRSISRWKPTSFDGMELPCELRPFRHQRWAHLQIATLRGGARPETPLRTADCGLPLYFQENLPSVHPSEDREPEEYGHERHRERCILWLEERLEHTLVNH